MLATPLDARTAYAARRSVAKHTELRSLILRITQASHPRALNAREMKDQLSDEGYSVAVQAIYKTAQSLEQLGLLWRELGAKGEMAWMHPPEYSAGLCRVVCIECGVSSSFTDIDLYNRIKSAAQQHGLSAPAGAALIQVACSGKCGA